MTASRLFENESRNSSSPVNRSNERGNNKKDSLRSHETDTLDNLEFQFDEIPIWENEFMNLIEQMRTIPYVLLGHYKFIQVNWIEDNVEENIEENVAIMEKMNTEEKQQSSINWDLVKRMIFSKTTKTMKSNEQLTKEISIKNSSGATKKGSIINYGKQIVSEFNLIYDYFRDFVSKRRKEKKLERQSEKNDRESNRSRENFKLFKAFESSKRSSESKFNVNRLKNKFKKRMNRQNTNLDKSSNNENLILGKNGSLSKKNLTELSKRILGGRKEVLIDLAELATSKRFYRLNLIMNRDDGPFVTDYRFLLGVEFWSSFCGVEKYQLISVCSNNFWTKELNSFKFERAIKKNKRFKSKTEHGLLSDLRQFLKGTDKPAHAPQRVISSEEKFRLIPYPKLFNPNTDLKKTFHSNTIQDQLNKKLKEVYKTLVYLIGGKYPLIRRVGFEEAYDDILLWVLDTYQAKTRFIALLNDQIKWEIN